MAEPASSSARMSFDVFLDGLLTALRSVFFYVLVGNYIGLGALAHGLGFSLWWMTLSTALIWAAPAQVILISTLNTASLLEIAVAVTLTSVRFLPMVAALLPTMRGPGVRPRDLIVPMHVTAISVWVEGMRLLPLMPAERRIPFYNGLGLGLMSGALLGGVTGFYLAAKLPPLLGAALLFFTPLAILMSSARNARTLIDGLSFGLGLVIGPVLAAQKIGLDLMWTGLIAGTLAYIISRWIGARRETKS